MPSRGNVSICLAARHDTTVRATAHDHTTTRDATTHNSPVARRFSSERADEVSRWVLAERAPVALPDKRWSTMAYGIRDCEEYLRAVSG